MSGVVSINIDSSVAVYTQIENQVQFAIAAGRLTAGDKLPSVREMSEQLGVNPNTVAKAYRDLEVMGLLRARRGMGVFVQEGVDSYCRGVCRKRVAERIYEVVSEAKAAGMNSKDIRALVSRSYESAGDLYGAVPKQVLQLAADTGKGK